MEERKRVVVMADARLKNIVEDAGCVENDEGRRMSGFKYEGQWSWMKYL